MEQQLEPDALDSYDAQPRDGPAVFVAYRPALERGQLRGRWLDATQTPDQLAASLEASGVPSNEPDQWVVIDQVGMGPVMVDEDATLAELTRGVPE